MFGREEQDHNRQQSKSADYKPKFVKNDQIECWWMLRIFWRYGREAFDANADCDWLFERCRAAQQRSPCLFRFVRGDVPLELVLEHVLNRVHKFSVQPFHL